MLAIASLEELFVYSGYVVLPSGIVLPGMARRTEAHFDSVSAGERTGNFGHLGLLDVLCRTTCVDEGDVVDDIHNEASKHRLQQHVQEAVDGAVTGLRGEQQSSNPSQNTTDVHSTRDQWHATAGQDREAGVPTAGRADDDEEVAADENADANPEQAGDRRSRRRNAGKA